MLGVPLLYVVMFACHLCHCEKPVFPNGTIPSPFRIRSITWANDNQLLLLYESYFLLGNFEKNLNLIESVQSYTFGMHQLNNASRYKAVFFWKSDKELYLNSHNVDGNFTLSGPNGIKIFSGDEYSLLMDSNANGIAFRNIPNLGLIIYDCSYQIRQLLTDEVVNFHSINYFQISQQSANSTKATTTTSACFSSQFTFEYSLFEQNPCGFLFESKVYMIYPSRSLVYSFDYNLIKSHLTSNATFNLSYDLYSFDDFFNIPAVKTEQSRLRRPSLLSKLFLVFCMGIVVLFISILILGVIGVVLIRKSRITQTQRKELTKSSKEEMKLNTVSSESTTANTTQLDKSSKPKTATCRKSASYPRAVLAHLCKVNERPFSNILLQSRNKRTGLRINKKKTKKSIYLHIDGELPTIPSTATN